MIRQDVLSVAVTLIAGIGIVGAAAFTAAATSRRERAARRADREARALTDFAEAAIDLRDALRRERAAPQHGSRECAIATFRYRRVAVHAVRVRDLAAAWEQAARDAMSTPDEVEAELATWDSLLTALGAALRDAY